MRKVLIIIFIFILYCGCFKRYSYNIKIDGSSTVYPVTEAVAEEFRKVYPDIRVTVGISGTGGGFKKFTRGEIDIANASRPISKEEIAACKKNNISFIELPVSYDGIVIVTNRKNDFVDYLTVAELKKIWSPEAQGKIKLWSQVRESWPAVSLRLYGAGTSSGTYDYFTEAIVGKPKSSRGDYTASEDDNVLVQGVANDYGGLAYFGFAYYFENKEKLKLIPIDDGIGPVFPNDSTIIFGVYQPLTRPEFIYINAHAASNPVVQKFISFYMKHAMQLVREVGYIPLGVETYKHVLERFDQKKTGSMFEERSVAGVNMKELLMLENE